jgi:hypothetical protein
MGRQEVVHENDQFRLGRHRGDGNQVYTRYTARTTNGNLWTNRVIDRNGCAAGTQTVVVYPWVVTRIQVCEQNVGCTAWHNH